MAGRNIQRCSKQELVEIYNTDKIEKLIKINVKYKTILDLHNHCNYCIHMNMQHSLSATERLINHSQTEIRSTVRNFQMPNLLYEKRKPQRTKPTRLDLCHAYRLPIIGRKSAGHWIPGHSSPSQDIGFLDIGFTDIEFRTLNSPARLYKRAYVVVSVIVYLFSSQYTSVLYFMLTHSNNYKISVAFSLSYNLKLSL